MTKTFTHTDKALAIARDTGWDLDEYAETMDWSGVGIGPVGQHRDSDELERSNWIVITDDLDKRFPETVCSVYFNHWAVGWVEEFAYDTGHAETVAAVQEWRDKLADYPCADEEHYSELELTEFMEWLSGLNLNYTDKYGIEWETVGDDWAERLSSEIDATRVDDCPGEPELARIAIDAGIMQPNRDSLNDILQEMSAAIERARDMADDIERGIGSFADLRLYLYEKDSDING